MYHKTTCKQVCIAYSFISELSSECMMHLVIVNSTDETWYVSRFNLNRTSCHIQLYHASNSSPHMQPLVHGGSVIFCINRGREVWTVFFAALPDSPVTDKRLKTRLAGLTRAWWYAIKLPPSLYRVFIWFSVPAIKKNCLPTWSRFMANLLEHRRGTLTSIVDCLRNFAWLVKLVRGRLV